jgi:aryl-alcohol dehydrogenase-like predicted oxidoreductase
MSCTLSYSAENFPNILKLAAGLKSIGEKYGGATAGQVALAWVLAQGEDIIPIPGTKKVKVCLPPTSLRNECIFIGNATHQYLEENVAALKLKLSAEDVQAVREVASQADAAQGERYPPGMVEMMFVDTPLP